MKKLKEILFYTFIIEGITIFFRFGLGMESKKETLFIRKFTFGFRIHHGHIGLLMIVLLLFLKLPEKAARLLNALGWAMILSDVFHHFVVLWIATGSPQFDLMY